MQMPSGTRTDLCAGVVSEVGPVKIEDGVVVHVHELVRERLSRMRYPSEQPVLAQLDPAFGAEATSTIRAAWHTADRTWMNRLALELEMLHERRNDRAFSHEQSTRKSDKDGLLCSRASFIVSQRSCSFCFERSSRSSGVSPSPVKYDRLRRHSSNVLGLCPVPFSSTPDVCRPSASLFGTIEGRSGALLDSFEVMDVAGQFRLEQN